MHYSIIITRRKKIMKEFNQKKYIQKYIKEHKKQFKVDLNIDEYNELKVLLKKTIYLMSNSLEMLLQN